MSHGGYSIKYLRNQIRLKPSLDIPHVVQVRSADHEHITPIPSTEPRVFGFVPAVINVDTDYIAWVVSGCDKWLTDVLLM